MDRLRSDLEGEMKEVDVDEHSDDSSGGGTETQASPTKVVKKRVTRKRKRKFTPKSTRTTRAKKIKEEAALHCTPVVEDIKQEQNTAVEFNENLEEITTEDEKMTDAEQGMEVDQETIGNVNKEENEGVQVINDVPDKQEEVVPEKEIKDEKEKKLVVELEHDTEMVSEDELPNDNAKGPLETEAVSDEELPTSAIDTLDTEAVSEDELPIEAKKKKADSPVASEDDKSNSKDENDLSEMKSGSQDATSDSPKSKKQSDSGKSSSALPELEKYWKAVENDVTDFSGWTYLLQYVDQENDVEAARKAYDSFLKHYPYCYGYWRKYADYERRKGDKSKCEEVYERGLKAIPLSVDLWLHYLNFCKSAYAEDDQHVRNQYRRAVAACGLEFRSDRLWDSYIKWETELKNILNVSNIFDQLLQTPTQGYSSHFANYEEFVRSNPPNKIVSVDEFLSLRTEVMQKIKTKPKQADVPVAPPPGDESDENDDSFKSQCADEETTMIKDKILGVRKQYFKSTTAQVIARWNFEERIKRPYFHVKPLEKCQLANWREYLEFEIQQGKKERILILFERCLIACALYEEFWLKFIQYLEAQPTSNETTEMIRHTYERACLIHHPKKPVLSLSWASFEESTGNKDKAREILCKLEKNVPHLLTIALRRIHLERRCNNLDEANRLFKNYIASAKNDSVYLSLIIKYAKFAWKILKDHGKAAKILYEAITNDEDNIRLYFLLIDLLISTPDNKEDECLELFDQMLSRDTIDIEQKVIIAQRKVEFLEDFGGSIKRMHKAQTEYIKYLKQWKDRKRATMKHELKNEELKKMKSDNPPSPSPNNSSYQNSNNSSQPGSYSQGPTNYQTNSGSGSFSQQSSYNQSVYNQSDQTYSNYQNWGYSQPNYNYNQNWGGYNYYS